MSTLPKVLDERVADELEAVNAIMLNDVSISDHNGTISVETIIRPEKKKGQRQHVCVAVQIKLTPNYPDERPKVVLHNCRGMNDESIATLEADINRSLDATLGQPAIFELIGVLRDRVTEFNLPSENCAICLYGFSDRDSFERTQCYHFFHSSCLYQYFSVAMETYIEERQALPPYQRAEVPEFRMICPICRSKVDYDMDDLEKANPPHYSTTDTEFVLTDEIKATQAKLSAILAHQIAKGGVVSADTGPQTLTISTPADNAVPGPSGVQKKGSKNENNTNNRGRPNNNQNNNNDNNNNANGQSNEGSDARPGYRGPYRGFNRRGKPGRRGRNGQAGPR